MKYVAFIALMFVTAILVLLSGFTLPLEVALMIFVLALSMDFITTWACMKAKGKEGNPLVGVLFRKVGLQRAFGILAAIWVGIIVFRFVPAVPEVQTALALVYWAVPANNIIVLRRLKRQVSVA